MRGLHWKQQIATTAIASGLALSLSQLWQWTQGANALLALSAAAILLAFYKKQRSASRLMVQSAILFLAMILISSRSSAPEAIGSGLAWGGIAGGLLFSAGLIRLSQLNPTQLKPAAQFELNASSAPENMSPPMIPIQTEIESVTGKPLDTPMAGLGLLLSDDEYVDDEDLEEAECEQESAEGEQILHAWTRSRQPDEERLEGSVIVEFKPGQKLAYVHVPFLPGFISRPHAMCYCDQDSIFTAEFDILQTYGGRLNARRRGDVTEAAETLVTFSVNAPWQFSHRAA